MHRRPFSSWGSHNIDLLEEVRKSKVKDDEVVKAMEEMKRAGVKILRDEE